MKYKQPVLSNATGTTEKLTIPVNFNGAELRRATAFLKRKDLLNKKIQKIFKNIWKNKNNVI